MTNKEFAREYVRTRRALADSLTARSVRGYVRESQRGYWIATSADGAHELCFPTKAAALRQLSAWEQSE